MNSVRQSKNAVKMLNSPKFIVTPISVFDILQSIEEAKKMQNLS